MGLFSKKVEVEKISQEVLDAIHISTLDYVPGYKVVKAFGAVATWSNDINKPILYEAEKQIKENAYKEYPECSATFQQYLGARAVGRLFFMQELQFASNLTTDI